jgi:hypothetical protein
VRSFLAAPRELVAKHPLLALLRLLKLGETADHFLVTPERRRTSRKMMPATANPATAPIARYISGVIVSEYQNGTATSRDARLCAAKSSPNDG